MGIAMKYVDEYNGWSNYETWKMNLEFFDGYPWEDYEDLDMGFPSFGYYLKDMAEEYLANHFYDSNRLVKGIVEDWLKRVNWDEIADAIRSNYREV